MGPKMRHSTLYLGLAPRFSGEHIKKGMAIQTSQTRPAEEPVIEVQRAGEYPEETTVLQDIQRLIASDWLNNPHATVIYGETIKLSKDNKQITSGFVRIIQNDLPKNHAFYECIFWADDKFHQVNRFYSPKTPYSIEVPSIVIKWFRWIPDPLLKKIDPEGSAEALHLLNTYLAKRAPLEGEKIAES